jgi:hypothetical protein
VRSRRWGTSLLGGSNPTLWRLARVLRFVDVLGSPQFTEPAIRKLFSDVAENYVGVPGLIRKYFGFTEDATSVIGIYLWSSRAAAETFYSPEWMAGVTERWGAAPLKSEWIVPVVAESVDGRS